MHKYIEREKERMHAERESARAREREREREKKVSKRWRERERERESGRAREREGGAPAKPEGEDAFLDLAAALLADVSRSIHHPFDHRDHLVVPHRSLRRGRQKSISSQGSGFQKLRPAPAPALNEFTPSNTLAWLNFPLPCRFGKTTRNYRSRCKPWKTHALLRTSRTIPVRLFKSSEQKGCRFMVQGSGLRV